MKKFPERSSFYTCVPNISITWCTVPVIRSETGRIFVILGYFLPFQPPDNLEIKILKLKNRKKKKKTFRDIIMIHICIINDNHMMYGSWDMERHRQNFLSFWTSFCPFIPLWTQKIQILEKWTIHLKKLSFYKCVP